MRPYVLPLAACGFHPKTATIDLDHLVAVHDPSFVNRVGAGGWFVQFSLYFLYRDAPITYQRDLIEADPYREHRYARSTGYFLKMADGSEVLANQIHQAHGQEPLCVLNVRTILLEPLIKAWTGQ